MLTSDTAYELKRVNEEGLCEPYLTKPMLPTFTFIMTHVNAVHSQCHHLRGFDYLRPDLVT